MENITEEQKQEYFEYLDELRGSGITNMFGAPAYLIEEFGLSRSEAKAVTSEWMKSK